MAPVTRTVRRSVQVGNSAIRSLLAAVTDGTLPAMPYRLLADLVLIVHAGFVAFVMLGALLVWRWPRIAWIHVPVVLWGAGIEFRGGICPLTPLESHWRWLGRELGYPGGFVEHYLVSALYPDGLTRRAQVMLGALVLLINVAIYAWVFRRRRQGR